MLLARTKALMPKVEGKSQATLCQKAGMLLCGHDTPEINSRGTEKNTTRSITFSRYLTRQETVRPKKILARI